jgi:low affinity Fe/Cu permease
MALVDFWFILWGILAAFGLQVVYDGVGEYPRFTRKFFVGALLVETLLMILVFMTNVLGAFGLWNTVITLVALGAVIITTCILYALKNKISKTKKESESSKPEALKLDKVKVTENTTFDISELISWFDDNELKVIKPQDIFFNWKRSFFLVFIVLFVIIEFTSFISASTMERIMTLLTAVAIFLAFMTIIIQTGEDNMIEGRLKNASKLRTFNDKEKAIVKALIKIKTKNEELKLKVLYAMDKESNGDIFTEKKLLESICK